MTKAFILEPSKNDISAAARFGEIVYLFDNGERRVSIWHDDFVADAMHSLESKGFDRNFDHFVIVGGMAPMIMMVSAMVAKFGHFNALLFDAQSRNYIVKTLGVDALNF